MTKHKSIVYHTRDYNNASVKLVGGTFGGSIDMDTIERLSRLFIVEITDSGTPVWVDKDGRRCWLYITVDPERTEKGRAALDTYRKERARREAEQMELERRQEEAIASIVDRIGYHEALRRLSQKESK